MPQRPTGPRGKPLEEHRRVHAGHRPLPGADALTRLPAPAGVPEPARPLGVEGAAMWRRVWTSGAIWLADKIDAETILILCEQVDERDRLRYIVLNDPDWRDRTQLRVLEKAIIDTLGFLGFNPTDRKRLAVAEVEASPLDDMMARRRDKAAGA